MNVKSAGQNKAFSTNNTLNIRGQLVDLSTPKVMGILNITPDSFYEGSRVVSEADILKKAEKMLTDGAIFLDVGGYSSRPGAENVSETEELKRTIGAIKSLSNEFPTATLSVDTFRAEVARQALTEGASLVNDISGGADKSMFSVVAKAHVPYVMMHMVGTPQTMQTQTTYNNLISDLINYFHKKIFNLQEMGITDILIDPGFGFAKTIDQNFLLLHHLEHFNILHKPLLVGVSRKSMIWKTLNIKPEDALSGTIALHMQALLKGASILRVHDVKEAVDTIHLYSKINNSKQE